MLPVCKLKNGVVINGAHFHREMTKIVDALRETAPPLYGDTVWITSGNDSKHKVGSLHYINRAFDIRIWNVIGGKDAVAKWVAEIKNYLGPGYDVILEVDHIHAEYDPK